MLIIFTLCTVLYTSFVIVLIYGWHKTSMSAVNAECDVKISIIIAARNEAPNLDKLLKDLAKQQYALNLFEVIVVDDDSDDGTDVLLHHFQRQSKIDLKVLKKVNTDGSPKKEAIQAGMDLANGELIVITDADCRVDEQWLSAMVDCFKSTNTKFISGPVKYITDDNLIGKLLQIEFSSLIGSGAATIYWNMPVMCNAANIAFPKEVFLEVDGFQGNQHQASGDDIYLMQKINARYPGQVRFLKDKQALVKTAHASSLVEFVNQRVRWSSKWKNVGGWQHKVLPIFIFIFHLLSIATLVMVVFGDFQLLIWLILFAIKFIVEYIFLREIMTFFSEKASFHHYLLSSFIYPFYAVYFGIAANINTFKWKDRKY